MSRLAAVLIIVVIVASVTSAQTETPTPTSTPTETPTPTPEPYVYATMEPEVTDEPGQMTRFDYVATAGEVHIANLLTLILISGWGMFLYAVLVRRR